MRLKRLLVRGFGQLRGEIRLETGAGTAALLLERNESGKSTLAAAIVASLYGLETDRRRARGSKVERDLYRPWGGGPYGLAMSLEVGGRELVIDRDFERDGVRVLEGSRDVTDQYQRGSRIAVGEALTGLTREQFQLSTFVGQGDIVWSNAAGLTEALQRVADSQEGERTAAAAVAALDHALTHYDGITLAGSGRVETEIDRCQKLLAERTQELDRLEGQHTEYASRIDELLRDEVLDMQGKQQHAILRARRLRSAADAVEEILQQDGQLQQRVQATLAEVEAAGSLDRLDAETLAQLDRLRRLHDKALAELEREEEQADRSATERAEAIATRDALGMSRRATEDDVDRMWQASVRFEDAGSQLQHIESRLADSERELATRGFRLDHAQELALRFEDLCEEDRVRLSSRTQEQLRLEERQASADEQYAGERQREAELRRSRARLRRAGWGGTLLAVVLAAAILVFSARLPFSLSVARSIAVALLSFGPALVILGSRRHGGELRDRRARQKQLEEVRLQLTEDRAEFEARWEELATRLQIPPDLLEEQYREYRTVEVAARNAASLQARLKELDRSQLRALEETSGLDAIFAERDRKLPLDEKLELLKRAVALFEHADQVAAVADAARQRVEVAKNAARQCESQLRQAIRDAGIEVSATDNIASAFGRIREEGERVRRALQLRDEVLPALRQRLLEPEAREAQLQHLETLRSEGLRLQKSIEEQMRSLGLDDSQLAATLSQPLTQSEFDERLQRLTEVEDSRRAQRDSDRAAIHAFLGRYEREAPRLREELERYRRALQRAEEFRAAVTLARDTLEEIGRQTHRTWSAALNRHCNEVLQNLGSRATRLGFDENLGLKLEQEGQQLTGQDASQHLSAGALDAIYLAARIAVSRFLSGGEEVLPLILDDPFANSDDARLRTGVELLLDQIAPRQQVLLMACQRSRYDWLREELGQPTRLVALDVGTGSSDTDDGDGRHHARA